MEKINIYYFKSLYGELILGSYGEKLCLCDWRYRKQRESIDSRIKQGLGCEYTDNDDIVLKVARRQLTEYFNHNRKVFDIPLLTVGTPFQKRVWNSLLNIPFGETASYLELAEEVADKKAVRAIAGANGANALSIFIPCHRIIGSNGNLAGYAGGTKVKAKLLCLERDLFNRDLFN